MWREALCSMGQDARGRRKVIEKKYLPEGLFGGPGRWWRIRIKDVHARLGSMVVSAILVLQYPARREKMWSQPKCTNKRTVSFLLDFSPTRLKFYPTVGEKSTQHCSLWKCDETSKVIPYFDLIKAQQLPFSTCLRPCSLFGDSNH